MKGSGYFGVSGIFICDGGCSALNETYYDLTELTREDVVSGFLRKNRQISFVFLIAIEEFFSPVSSPCQRLYNKLELYPNQYAYHPVPDEISELLFSLEKLLPQPESSPANAIRKITNNPHNGSSFYGGYSIEFSGGNMSGDTIKISSRTLAELLSGALDIETFLRDHFNQSDKDSHLMNFFRDRLLEGKTIQKISLEKNDEADDDWISITFAGPDVAISPYQ